MAAKEESQRARGAAGRSSTCVNRNATSVAVTPVMKSFLAGAMSGSVSTVLLQPLDLVKTRLQSSVYFGSNTGMLNVAVTVVRQERFLALWNGLWPSLTRSSEPSSLESLCMGMTARSMTAAMILPITVIKTRFESGAFNYRGMANALVVTYKTEGVRGLYSGLAPTLLRDVPFSGLYLMFFTKLKMYNQPSTFGPGLEPMVDFCNGVLAGALASFVTQPADVIKTKMQLYPQKHRHVVKVIAYVYKERGLYGFWRGIVPRTLRRTVMAALAWTVFEEISRRCNLK